MTFDFTGLYEFHGHRCPMSTMGARLGIAALAGLGVSKSDQFRVEGRYFARNCALDGIQYTTGCTLGNGNLAFEDAGRFSFVLKMRDGARGVAVDVSQGAMARLAAHKALKAELMTEKEISGLSRAMEIDREIARDFDALVEWVQTASDGALLTITGA